MACTEPEPGPAPAGPGPRIVSLAPHLTELVYTAGAGDKLVGVVQYSDYPEAALALPVIGDAFRVDLERMTALRPDVVLGWRGGNPDEVLAQLQRHGYRVAALTTGTLSDVAATLEEIGRLAGTEAVARPRAQAYRERLWALRQRYGGLAQVSVFYQISERPLYTVGGPHPISEMIEVCGGRNIFAELDSLAPVVSIEEVLLRRPDVIIAGEPPAAQTEHWRKWEDLPAARSGHLYGVDASVVARSSTRILEGLQQICERLDRARN